MKGNPLVSSPSKLEASKEKKKIIYGVDVEAVQAILRERQRRNMVQYIADHMGMSRTAMSRILNGHDVEGIYRVPEDFAERLSAITKIPMEFVTGQKEVKFTPDSQPSRQLSPQDKNRKAPTCG